MGFRKFETALMGYLGALRKLIHEKNMKSKISWHYPFKVAHHEHNHSTVVDPEPDPNKSALIGSPASMDQERIKECEPKIEQKY